MCSARPTFLTAMRFNGGTDYSSATAWLDWPFWHVDLFAFGLVQD